ncbi:MAG: hypothetical protein ABJA98_27890 [Acidobacteriota bacterium]
MHRDDVSLVNEYGQPFSARLNDALTDLAPRLRAAFPILNDPYALTEILEEAARNIMAREAGEGAVDDLRAYAWTTATHTVVRRLKRGEWAVQRASLSVDDSASALASMLSAAPTLDQIEAEILAREIADQLSPDDQHLLRCRRAGLSLAEIAQQQRRSRVAVESSWRRVKRRMYSLAAGIARRPGQVRG